MPVRRIPKNYRNVTGIVAETKALGQAQFESTLERDFLKLLEFSPDVSRYEVQPVTIEWRSKQGQPRSYTPDVWVEFRDDLKVKPWLCEVKHRSDIKKNWADLHPKFRCGIRHARSVGAQFRLITEVEIRTPFLSNAVFLLPFRQQMRPKNEIDAVLETLRRCGKTTVENLLKVFSTDLWEQAEWLPTVWHLVANFRIGADLDVKLTQISPVWSLS
jgi:hypothetical protein